MHSLGRVGEQDILQKMYRRAHITYADAGGNHEETARSGSQGRIGGNRNSGSSFFLYIEGRADMRIRSPD